MKTIYIINSSNVILSTWDGLGKTPKTFFFFIAITKQTFWNTNFIASSYIASVYCKKVVFDFLYISMIKYLRSDGRYYLASNIYLKEKQFYSLTEWSHVFEQFIINLTRTISFVDWFQAMLVCYLFVLTFVINF